MRPDLRHHQEPALNLRALLKACFAGALIVFIFWLGSLLFAPADGSGFRWIIGGAVVATVFSAFLAGVRCGSKRREDGVAHGISAWFTVLLFSALALLPTVNALDLKGTENNFFERAQILITEASADNEAIAARAQLTNLLARFGLKAEPSSLTALEKSASEADHAGTRDYVQARWRIDAEQADVIASHVVTLFQDPSGTAADRAVLHANIRSAATAVWWLTLLLLGSLLLSMWAGAGGVRLSSSRS